MDIPVVTIGKADVKEISVLLQTLQGHSIDFSSCFISQEVVNIFKYDISKTNFYSELLFQANKFLYPANEGFLVIDFQNLFDHNTDPKRAIPIILSALLHPFGIFTRYGLWKEIGVDLNKEANRSSGTGYNPFHIDFVNTTCPPFYSVLFCIREDPNKGGQTIVSNIHKAIEELSGNELDVLREAIFTEGSFYGLSNVGNEYNPFPVIQNISNGEMIIRFTSKINTKGSRFNFLVKRIEELLIKNQKAFLLKRNQLVIFNQRTVCHGRLALNGSQEKISQSNTRLLLQIFGKNHEQYV